MKKVILVAILLLVACTPRYARNCADVPRFTLGQAQLYIHEGMSGAEVASFLGSPNIVTKDQEGNETWVYDKVACTRKSDSRGFSFFLFGGSSLSTVASQETTTVVIKFDSSGKVASVTYHASKF